MQRKDAATALPKPARGLEVEQVAVMAPGSPAPIVANVRFGLAAGEALGIIGPSGAGKTSLARVLVGIWPPAKGSVRLDGAALDQWDPELLGRHVGFVSQTVELFDGTISENIARMNVKPDADAVLRAAKAAGAHELILRLPNGYDTPIGEGGEALSGGQRQRIALARALYGDPFLIVLDEPNSNLDNEGEMALRQAIANLKTRGAIVVLIAHRPSVLAVCDHILVLSNGEQKDFGSRDEIMPSGWPLSTTGTWRNPPSYMMCSAWPSGRSGPIVRGFLVMAEATGVVFGSLSAATTRNTTSRSVKIQTTWPSSTMSRAPTLCSFIRRAASAMVVCDDVVGALRAAITSRMVR